MIDDSKYDAIGELFRRKLENHRIPVDDSGWNEIEKRLGKPENNAVIWLWSAAVAASIAALLVVGYNIPIFKNSNDSTIQQFKYSNIQQFNDSTIQQFNNSTIPIFNDSVTQLISHSVNNEDNSVTQLISYSVNNEPDSVIQLISYSVNNEPDSVIQLFSYSVNNEPDSVIQLISYSVNQSLDISLVEDSPDEDETYTEIPDKWLLATVLSFGGYTGGAPESHSNDFSPGIKSWDGLGSGNRYAAEKSGSIQSFSSMERENFKSINHRPPFSIGMTAWKTTGKRGGLESGLVYTFLSSRFEWSEWADYDVQQNLHYIGIPVNLMIYLGDKSKPNWRTCLSGGFMVEKGLRAIYRQERQNSSEHRITTVKSSIDGLQCSLNCALIFNYRLEKGFGIYFGPRAGYCLKNDQPISIRTESPVYLGINFGLNYEL